MKPVKQTRTNVKTWKANLDDLRLLAALKAKFGITHDSEVVRMGLRKLAQAEGIK